MDLLFQVLLIIVVIIATKRIISYCSKPKKDRLSRPLGSIEETVHRKLLASNEPNTVRALGIKVKAGHTLDKKHITEALRLLKARHAPLQVTIQEKADQLWFVPYHDDSRIPYTERNSNNWVQEVEKELDENRTTFEGDLLWRVTRLYSTDNKDADVIIFNIHHAIMDGLAMSHMMVELTEILNDVVSGEVDVSKPAKVHDHLMESSEHYMLKHKLINFWPKFLVSIVDIIPVSLQKLLIKRVMGQLVSKMTPDEQSMKESQQIFSMFKTGVIESGPREKMTTIVPMSLTQQETKTLIMRTKENKSTCYGVIVAASSLALAEMIEDISGKPIECFESKPLNKTRTTVNLRRYFNGEVPETYMGTFMGVCSQDVDINFGKRNKRELLLETAEKFTKDIQRSLKEKTIVSTTFLAFSLMKQLAKEMNEMMSKAKEAGSAPALLAFNNYGAVGSKPQQQKQKPEDHLVEATFLFNVVTEHNTPITPLFTVNCVTINGHMSIGVLYYTHQTTQETAKKFAHKLKRILLNNM